MTEENFPEQPGDPGDLYLCLGCGNVFHKTSSNELSKHAKESKHYVFMKPMDGTLYCACCEVEYEKMELSGSVREGAEKLGNELDVTYAIKYPDVPKSIMSPIARAEPVLTKG